MFSFDSIQAPTNWYELCSAAGAIVTILYALASLILDYGNSVEEDWYQKYPEEYVSPTQCNKLAAHSRIHFSWNHHPTVGQTMQIFIRLYENSNRGTVAHNLTKYDKIVVKIVKQKENFEVKCNPEESKRIGSDVSNYYKRREENEAIYSFVPQKAGLYDISVYINEEKMYVCPITKCFLPENEVDNRMTSLHRGMAPILCISGKEPCKLIVFPKDRYGNNCFEKAVDISKFSWQITQIQSGSRYEFTELNATVNSLNYRDSTSSRIIINFEVPNPGIFNGKLLYKKMELQNCYFTIVCVTEKENEQIMNVVKKDLLFPMEFEAQLLQNEANFDLNIGLLKEIANNTQKCRYRNHCELIVKRTNVKVIMTPTMIYVHNFSSEPSNLSTGIIQSAHGIDLGCMICVLFSNSKTNVISFEIRNTEGTDFPVQLEMKSSDLRIFMSIFSMNLLKNTAGKDRYEAKFHHFLKELQNRNARPIDRNIAKLDIPLDNVLLITIQCTKDFTSIDWKNMFIIKFAEETLNYDKALINWFLILFNDIFRFSKENLGNYKGTFIPAGESLLIHPHPGTNAVKNVIFYHEYWKFVGNIIGKSIFECCIGELNLYGINARFTRSFLAQILGTPPNYKHFMKDDPEFYRSHVSPILSDDVTHMNLQFEDTIGIELGPGCARKVAIIPYGSRIKVTNENKLQYLNALARFRYAERMKREIQWILQGIHEVVPLDSFISFTENELELLICGSSSYTIEEMLGDQSKYKNITDSERIIFGWFSKAVTAMSQDNKGRLLQLATGSSLLPAGGFLSISPNFMVQFSTEDFGGLPKSNMNRINSICLPNHYNYANFEKSLIIAINEGREGYFSIV